MIKLHHQIILVLSLDGVDGLEELSEVAEVVQVVMRKPSKKVVTLGFPVAVVQLHEAMSAAHPAHLTVGLQADVGQSRVVVFSDFAFRLRILVLHFFQNSF